MALCLELACLLREAHTSKTLEFATFVAGLAGQGLSL